MIAAFRDVLPAVTGLVSEVLGGGAESLATKFLGMLTAAGHVAYGGELRGVARAAGITLGQIVVL